MLFFIITHLKVLLHFFLKINRVLAKNKKNHNPAHKMVEKFGKSWVLLICQVDLITLLFMALHYTHLHVKEHQAVL